jgi:hypothetical protein
MIFFVPDYDPATAANLVVALRIAPEPCVPLLGTAATREGLLAALARGAAPLFALAHGRPGALLGQGGTPALTAMDAAAVGRRVAYVYACHSAVALGESAAREGGVWWGYTGAVTAPDVPEPLLNPIVEVFLFLRDVLMTGEASTDGILNELVDRCRAAERRVDDLLTDDPELEVGTAYLCLLQLWQRLRIWQSGAATPQKHPEAPEPLLF